MRIPISVQVISFDIESVQPEIDAVREVFFQYLKLVPRKSTRSKHGLMGPVGKILNKVKRGQYDPESLIGFALRVHESGGKSPSYEAVEILEQGINQLTDLLTKTPVMFHDRILERLDNGLYFVLRKNELLVKETLRREWISYLRKKYGNEATLSEAWGENVSSIDELYLPRKAEGERKRPAVKQEDIMNFWNMQKE